MEDSVIENVRADALRFQNDAQIATEWKKFVNVEQ